MNFNFLALLGFIGSVICAQAPSSGLAEFERKLSTSISGEHISNIVNDPVNLPDYLDGMASKPANYVIPITDKYKLYRFFKGVIAHYEKAEKDAGFTGTAKVNGLKKKIADLDKDIDELTKAHNASLFRWMGKDPSLTQKENYRTSLQTDLAREERTNERATIALPKFQRFANRFEPYKQCEELLKNEEVTTARDNDAKRKRR